MVAAAPPHALLSLKDVHTYILGSHILQGISFSVPQGQTTVLLGRNGAGKSTTLRTVMGLWKAERGQISLDGANIIGKQAYEIARSGVALVPEDREVFVSLTVEDNLKLALRPHASNPNALERIYDLFPDLRAARSRSAGAMSGGQQQMLAIGRALLNRNRILLIDEPTKGLAPVIVKQLQGIFRSLQEAGQTILLVEQNLEFAAGVGDQYLILDEGHIVNGGRMADLSSQSELLRRYIGV